MDNVFFRSKIRLPSRPTLLHFPVQPSVSKRDPVRFGAAACSTARARPSSRLCAAKASCCCASLSRFISFIASRLCAFWRCFFVCGAAVDVAAVPPSDVVAALLGPVNGERHMSSDKHLNIMKGVKQTSPASHNVPTTFFLA